MYLEKKNNRTFDAILAYNQYQVLRNVNYFNLKGDINNNASTLLLAFSNNAIEIWNANIAETNYLFFQNNCNCANTLDKTQEQIKELSEDFINSGNLTFKILNLLRFNCIAGNLFTIEDINEIQGKKVLPKNILINSMEQIKFKISSKTDNINASDKSCISVKSALTCINKRRHSMKSFNNFKLDSLDNDDKSISEVIEEKIENVLRKKNQTRSDFILFGSNDRK